MDKEAFLRKLRMLYRVCNAADSDSAEREDWTHPDMACTAAYFDDALRHMLNLKVLTPDEHQEFYDML